MNVYRLCFHTVWLTLILSAFKWMFLHKPFPIVLTDLHLVLQVWCTMFLFSYPEETALVLWSDISDKNEVTQNPSQPASLFTAFSLISQLPIYIFFYLSLEQHVCRLQYKNPDVSALGLHSEQRRSKTLLHIVHYMILSLCKKRKLCYESRI